MSGVMESSSDESFAWTNASSDSSVNKTAPPKMNGNRSEEESEYGSKYKKKLHKEIFGKNQNGSVSQNSSQRKITHEHSDSDCKEAVSKKIKVEPESDCESHSKKRKKKGMRSYKDTSEEENYLRARVKEEHTFTGPESKQVQKRRRLLDSEEKELGAQLKLESEREKRNMDHSTNLDNSLHESDDGGVDREVEHKKKKQKKKKSKKRRNSSETSAMSVDEILNAEQTIAEDMQQNITVNTTFEHSKDEISIIEKVIPSQNHDIPTPNLGTKKEMNNGRMKKDVNSVNNSSQILTDKSVQRLRKPSYRIEEEELEMTMENELVASSKLQKFVNKNSHLKPIVEQVQNELAIRMDDELWLIHCPSELETASFQSKALTLEGKCKVKVDGCTYEGYTVPVDDRVGVMTMKHNKHVISGMPLAGVIHLRRRVPKAHVQGNNMIEQSMAETIPMPVTKCRHPLFGADYKATIKIAAEIKDKLKATPPEMPGLNIKKKKKRDKKENQITHLKDDNDHFEPKEETHTELVRHKKKKRKISGDDAGEGAPRKKKKSTKHNISSSGGWDTEKAIEQNLFNF